MQNLKPATLEYLLDFLKLTFFENATTPQINLFESTYHNINLHHQVYSEKMSVDLWEGMMLYQINAIVDFMVEHSITPKQHRRS